MKIEVKTASGRLVEVSLSRGSPTTADEVRVYTDCKCLSHPQSPHAARHSHGVAMSGVAAGTHSLADSFWRVWTHNPYPGDAANVVPPPGLVAGGSKTVDGQTWLAGVGKPLQNLGKPGQWYVDLASGYPYKRVRGMLQKLAESRAEEYDTWLTGVEQLETLNLPFFEEPAPEPRKPLPQVIESFRAQIESEMREKLMPEAMAEAERRLRPKLHQEILDELSFESTRGNVYVDKADAAQSAKPAVEPEK